jgi:hypothetical protein
MAGVITYIGANILSNVATNLIMDSIRTPGYHHHSSIVSYNGSKMQHSTTHTYVPPSYNIPSINNPFSKKKKNNIENRVYSPFEKPPTCNPYYTCRGVLCEEYSATTIDELNTKPGQACWVELYLENTKYYIIYRDRDGAVGLVPKYAVNVYGNLEELLPKYNKNKIQQSTQKNKMSKWKKFKNIFSSKPKISNEEAIRAFIKNMKN